MADARGVRRRVPVAGPARRDVKLVWTRRLYLRLPWINVLVWSLVVALDAIVGGFPRWAPAGSSSAQVTVDLDRSGHVGNVRVHCYGCDAVVQVDEDLPAEGLRVARWYNDHGETFCPKCARRRGLPDPWGSQSPWADYDQRYRDTGDSVTAARESVPLGPAIDDPETYAAVTRYGRRAWLWLAAGAALFAATLAFTEISAKRADELLRTGAHTPGLVVSYASGRGPASQGWPRRQARAPG